MGKLHDKTFPNESAAYRNARNELLHVEIGLRRQLESVAAFRRALPLGGKLKENYVFDSLAKPQDSNAVKSVSFSDLFSPGKDTLVIYSFMYGSAQKKPCPSCTSILDGLDGASAYVNERVNFFVCAKAAPADIAAFAKRRKWEHLRLLSSSKNTYNVDYGAENPDGSQSPALNVFVRKPEGIFHFYNAELLYAPSDPGQNMRHVDLIWPVWNLLDLTPEGRGTDWYPDYSKQ